MQAEVLEKLRRDGAVVSLPEGEGVLVSLQISRIPALPRRKRKEFLADAFTEVRAALAPAGVRIDLESVSVSAQTADAIIPSDRFDEIVSLLEEKSIRTDPLVDRQVLALP